MLHFWASHVPLLCLAFLLPSIVNCLAAVGFVYVASCHLFYRVVAITVWLVVLTASLLLMLLLFAEATMLERAQILNVFCTVCAALCIELFHRTFKLISWALSSDEFNPGDWWWDDDSDDNWDDDDDDPDPLLPAPIGPSAGRTLQTCSSRISWSVT